MVSMAYDGLMATCPKTINSITSTYFASKSKVKRNVKQIENWLDRFDFQLIMRKGGGLYEEEKS